MMDEGTAGLLGVNRTDGRCLDIIDRHGTLTAGRLAEESGLSSGAVTAVLDRLEKAGFVRRVRDTKDRRRVMVEITDVTREVSDLVYGNVMELGQALMGRMSAEQVRTVTRFLEVNTRLNRELALLLKTHLPGPDADLAERLDRARAFNRAQSDLLARLQGEFESGED